jgi:tetratricopeptide (TPR) repeat protein
MEIDDGKQLTNEDIDWLEARELFQALAFYYERIGLMARAGSYWRKVGNPQMALEITERARADSAILTMRGGAFRDIGNLDNAHACGQRAIELAPKDYHPYNLLRAVYYQRGDPEEGDKYFERARELGSHPKNEERNIRSAVKKARPEEKRRVAEYLLKKDPERFQWVQKYIEPG